MTDQDGPTAEELHDLADNFYGFSNELAYTAGPTKYAPTHHWPAAKRRRWSQFMTIATLISDLADDVENDDEPGVELPGPKITEEDG